MLMIPRPLQTIGLIAIMTLLIIGVVFSVSLTVLQGQWGSTDHTIQVPLEREDGNLGTLTGHIELNQLEFATGWKAGGGTVKSEAINVDLSQVTFDWSEQEIGIFTVWGYGLLNYHYEWFINGALIETGPEHTGGGDVDENTPEKTKRYTLLTDPVTYIVGTETGVLTSKLVGDIIWAWFDIWPFPHGKDGIIEDAILGEFDAELKSGEGYVRLGDSLPDVIEEGSNVEFLLKTGFTHNQGWICYIISPQEEQIEFREDGFQGQDGFSSLVDFTIPYGWFVEGGDNECEIKLYNHLWEESVSTFFVIDDISKSPGKPDIIVSSNYESGSTVDVSVTAEPNPITMNPIDYFRVYAYYGVPGSMPGFDFPGEYMIQGSDYSATNNSVILSFELPANREGQVSIKVNAIDTSGRASLGAFYSMDTVIGAGGGPVDPNVNYPWTPTLPAILVIGVMIAIISIAFAIKPIRKRLTPGKKKYWWVWVLLLLSILGILAYFVLWLGTNPGVMF